jgi:hypothetical protein
MAFKKRGRAIGLTLTIASVLILAVALIPQSREAVLNTVRGFTVRTPTARPATAFALNGITIRQDRIERTQAGTVVHVSATDIGGASVAVIRARGLADADYLFEAGGTRGWDLRLPPSMKTLIIDEVTVREGGAATVELDIPPSGSISINRVLAIGRYPVSLTTGTCVDDGPNGHVFRIGFHTAPVAGRLLGSWAVDGVGSSILEGPAVRTGDGWFEFAADAGHTAPPGHVGLSFTDPMVDIAGPWVLPLG